MCAKVVLCAAAGVLILAAQAPKQAHKGDAGKGKAVFADQCAVCHALDASKKLGPGMKGLFKKARLQNGQPLNDTSVRALVDAGGNGMPPYKDLLTAAQKNDLLAYLKTL
jgi:mono/diheme cytochrome c family protein